MIEEQTKEMLEPPTKKRKRPTLQLSLPNFTKWSTQQIALLLCANTTLANSFLGLGLEPNLVHILYKAKVDGSTLFSFHKYSEKDIVAFFSKYEEQGIFGKIFARWFKDKFLKKLFPIWNSAEVKQNFKKQFKISDSEQKVPNVDGKKLAYICDCDSTEAMEYLLSLGYDNTEVNQKFINWVKAMNCVTIPDIDLSFNIDSRLDFLGSIMSLTPTTDRHLLTNPRIDIPYRTNEKIIETLSSCFNSLLSVEDKSNVNFPFLACSPGTGKSRTLQEIFRFTNLSSFANTLEIHISFGNVTYIANRALDYRNELFCRILYAYKKAGYFDDIRNSFTNSPLTIEQLFTLIYDDCMKGKTGEDENLYIYLAIDEFTELLDFVYTNGIQPKTYLEGIIRELGSFIVYCNVNGLPIHILPFFAGLDSLKFNSTISNSGFKCTYISPYIFTTEDVSSLVSGHFPSLRFSPYLWKTINMLGTNPRLLEYFIFHLCKKSSPSIANIQTSYLETVNTGQSMKFGLSSDSARKVLAYVLLGEKLQSLDDIFDNDKQYKWKQLEDIGLIRLIPNENGYQVTSSLFYLEKFCISLLDMEERRVFSKLWTDLYNSVFTCYTCDRKFESFNGVFDIARNYCLKYLGHKTLSLKNRFKGLTANTTWLEVIKKTEIDLEQYPKILLEDEVNIGANQIYKLSTNKMVQNRVTNSEFFDRFSSCKTTGEISTILWQDRGTNGGLKNFADNDLQDIHSAHFIPTKLSSIGTNEDDCLAIVVTTRPLSSKIEIPDKFAVIARDGLYTYFGPFVSDIFLLTIPTPFPIMEFEVYSDYDLAIFLGIEKSRAANIKKQLQENKLDLLKSCVKEMNISESLLNYSKSNDDSIIRIPRDGNCMFASCILGMKNLNLGIEIDIIELRKIVAEKLNEHTDLIVEQMRDIVATQSFDGLGLFGSQLKEISNLPETERDTEYLDLVPTYIENMKENGVWGGCVELGIIARHFNIDIIVKGELSIRIKGCSTDETPHSITLLFQGNHYDLFKDMVENTVQNN